MPLVRIRAGGAEQSAFLPQRIDQWQPRAVTRSSPSSSRSPRSVFREIVQASKATSLGRSAPSFIDASAASTRIAEVDRCTNPV